MAEENVDTETEAPVTPDAPEPTPVPVPEPDAPKPAPPKTEAEPLDLKAEALKKANREAAERRQTIKVMEAEIAALKLSNASAEERALAEATKRAAEDTEAKYRPAVVKANANAALAAAGCKDAEVRKTLLRLVDAKAVEIGDDGDVTGGLDDQIESLKVQFPEKFETPKPAVPSARQVDAGDKKPAPVQRTTTDELVKRLTGAYPNT